MGRRGDFSHIPVIDVSELVAGGPTPRRVAEELGAACRESGFFYVVGHGVDAAPQSRLRDFRMFNYPPPADLTLWGVGEHTDYGLLTISASGRCRRPGGEVARWI